MKTESCTTIMDNEKMLTRIANHLIMNASFLTDLGLYHGKMGIVLFFAHYARYTGETLYDDFAGKLFDEIAEDIHTEIPLHFEYGLSGIGWGVEYLLQNNFMEGDSDMVLSDIDNKIMEKNLCKVTDSCVQTGLGGILYYIEKRLNSSRSRGKPVSFDESFLSDYKYVKNKYKIMIPEEKQILSDIWENIPGGENITEWKLGIKNGCAGYGLKCILG